jgi:hypothetical protein
VLSLASTLAPPLLQLSAQLLDGAQLKFYQYEGDMNELLDGVRTHINQLAESWTPEQKKHCLAETASSFQVGGQGDRQHGNTASSCWSLGLFTAPVTRSTCIQGA